MKFLLIASFPHSILNFRKELIEKIQSKSYKVHIAGPNISINSSISEQLNKMGVVVHEVSLIRTSFNPINDLLTFIQLFGLIKMIRPTHVLAYTIKPVIYGMLAAYLAKVPKSFALITGLGFGFTGEANGFRGILRSILIKMYKLALCNTSKVFFQNPDDKTLFKFLNIISSSNKGLIVNGSGVNIKHYSEVKFPKKISFLMIGRFLVAKGVREYVHAANRIHKKYPKILFYLVGWIDDNPDAIKQNELDKWINDKTIIVLGKLKDVRPAITDSSVYVLPSNYREGTPRTVLEAMAMGRPIITTDAPGCRETVENGVNGYLVPAKSVDALEDAMGKFINNPKLCFQMGKESRRIFKRSI
jgi:glycosyltransferase involved in cell wall biosynthesis